MFEGLDDELFDDVLFEVVVTFLLVATVRVILSPLAISVPDAGL